MAQRRLSRRHAIALAAGAAIAGVTLASSTPSRAAPRFELVMFEEAGCPWCERWREEVGGAYPKTAEGRAAPLRVEDVHAAVPADLALKSRAFFSPTFILVKDGVEIGRIEGYPGEDFFWGLLGAMLARAGAPL